MMPERRCEQRILCSHLVRLRPRARGGLMRGVTAVLEDISSAGACLQLEEPVVPGSAMILAIGRHSFPGRVRYCVFRETGYFVGLQFDSGVRWSKEQVAPEHLVDPREIRARLRSSPEDPAQD